jgi:act minimal PKS acyl carrier protein
LITKETYMSTMTIDDLRGILIDCAGTDDTTDLFGEITDRTFEELGYDSLALMETAARIQQQYGVQVADEVLLEVKTPGALLELVNSTTGPA